MEKREPQQNEPSYKGHIAGEQEHPGELMDISKKTQMEISFEHVLRKACRAINPKNVLEWGPGKSTRMIVEECPGAKVLSIEHSKKWFNLFNQNPLKNVTLMYRPLDLRGGTGLGYVTWPMYLYETKQIKKFDLIFIDGRYRFDCLMVAKYLLTANGCVIIHDAHRKAYHAPFKLFKYQRNDKDTRTTILSDVTLDYFDDSVCTWWNPINRVDTLSSVCTKLKTNESFYHVRFGDAELVCIDNPMFANKRHQPTGPELSKELEEALSINHPMYQIACTMSGWNPGKLRRLRRILSKYFHTKTFYYVTFLHETFVQDFEAFVEFTKLFKDKKVLLIGGPTVCKSNKVKNAFNVSSTIQLSDKNAYYKLDSNMNEIVTKVKSHDVTISALGWASTVLAKRLWRLKIRKVQYIDIGSVVDALAGAYSNRGWIKKNLEYVREKRRCF